MNNIETALQKTVGFGCREFADKAMCVINGTHGSYEEMLLDPTVWRDVARVERWSEYIHRPCGEPMKEKGTNHFICWLCYEDECVNHSDKQPEWQYKMHQFLDALIEQV